MRAVHLILDFEPILRTFQEIGYAIRAGDPWINRIDVSKPNFLAQDDLPPRQTTHSASPFSVCNSLAISSS